MCHSLVENPPASAVGWTTSLHPQGLRFKPWLCNLLLNPTARAIKGTHMVTHGAHKDLPLASQKHRVFVIKSQYVRTSGPKRPAATAGGSNTTGNHVEAPPLSGPEAALEGVLSSITDSPNCAALLHQKQRHPKSSWVRGCHRWQIHANNRLIAATLQTTVCLQPQ